MNEHDEVTGQLRQSFSGLRMDRPVEQIFARSRARRRRQLTALTGAATATTGAVAAVTLTLGAPGPAHPGQHMSPSPASLAAFSVTSGPGDSTTLILRKGSQYRLDPAALRRALARHGIPALVTVGKFCRSVPGATASSGQFKARAKAADESAVVLNGRTMPPRTRLSIGYFPSYVRMALIKDGGPLACSRTPGQPAAHIAPSGQAKRGRQ